jgi:O-antigen/teichoic acid export membrane protein
MVDAAHGDNIGWYMKTTAAAKTAQTLAAHLLIFAQGLVLTPVIIKVAGLEIYGGYILLLSYLGIIFGISSAWVGIKAKRYLPSTIDSKSRADKFYPQFWFQISLAIVLALISVVAYLTFIEQLRPKLPSFSAWIVLPYLLAHSLYSQATDYFRYTHRLNIFNIATVLQPYLFVCAAIAIFWSIGVLNIDSLILSLTLASTIVGSLIFLRLAKEIGIQVRLPSRQELGIEMKLGLPVMLSFIVDIILLGSDRYVIAILLSIRDVGIYVPAYTLGSLVLVFPKVIGVVLPPLLSQRIDSGDEIGAKRLSNSAAQFFLLISVPYVVGAAMVGEDILRLYANNEVAEAAWPVIPIVALGSIFYGLLLIKANVLFVRLKTGALLQINLICALLNIGLNIVLIGLFGNVIVAAVATLVSYLLSYILLSLKLRGDLAIFKINTMWIARVLFTSAAMALILHFAKSTLDSTRHLSIFLVVLVGVLAYTTILLLQTSYRTELKLLIYSFKIK